MPPKPNMKHLMAQVARWNAAHKTGAAVIVTRDNGDLFETRTRSQASILSGHTAVIYVDGIAGCYLLDRVKPRGTDGT